MAGFVAPLNLGSWSKGGVEDASQVSCLGNRRKVMMLVNKRTARGAGKVGQGGDDLFGLVGVEWSTQLKHASGYSRKRVEV